MLLTVFILLLGPNQAFSAETVSNTIYLNTDYIKEDIQKLNCELNGAWSSEYSYYWIPGQSDNLHNLPSFVKSVQYNGIIEQTSLIGISTLESSKNSRNGFYITSSLPGESTEINLELENNSNFGVWYPLSIYIDPFVSKIPEQQVRIKLSYALDSLGDIVYIQNTKYNKGCYLNLLIKGPPKGTSGKATIELKTASNTKPVVSGLFWGTPREEKSLPVNYDGRTKVEAPLSLNNLFRENYNAIVWSPDAEEDTYDKDIIDISLGSIEDTTSTGYEFVSSRVADSYSFKVIKGQSGPDGFNGAEFYLSPPDNTCINGCTLGLYFAENFKQKVLIYSAFEDSKNTLLAETETSGDGLPSFETFKIESTDTARFRIRITNESGEESPIFRGLFLISEADIEADDINNVASNDAVINETPVENVSVEISVDEPNESDSTNNNNGNNNGNNNQATNGNTTVSYGNGPVWNDPDFISHNPNVIINQSASGNGYDPSFISALVENVRNSPRGGTSLKNPKLTAQPAPIETSLDDDDDDDDNHGSNNNDHHTSHNDDDDDDDDNHGSNNNDHHTSHNDDDDDDDDNHGSNNNSGNNNHPSHDDDDDDFNPITVTQPPLPNNNSGNNNQNPSNNGNGFNPIAITQPPLPNNNSGNNNHPSHDDDDDDFNPITVTQPPLPNNNSGNNNHPSHDDDDFNPITVTQPTLPNNNSGNNNQNPSNNGNNSIAITQPTLPNNNSGNNNQNPSNNGNNSIAITQPVLPPPPVLPGNNSGNNNQNPLNNGNNSIAITQPALPNNNLPSSKGNKK